MSFGFQSNTKNGDIALLTVGRFCSTDVSQPHSLLCVCTVPPLQCNVCTGNDSYTCTQDANHRLQTCRADENLCVTYQFLALGVTSQFERRCSTLEDYKKLIDACYSPPPADVVIDSACFVAHCSEDGCKAQIQY